MKGSYIELTRAVGSYFLKLLSDAEGHPALVIGADRWSHNDVLQQLGVMQPKACSILSRVAKEMKVKHTKDLYNQTSPYILAGTSGVGLTTLYVLLRVFQASGLDVDKWYIRGEKEAVVTFGSLKTRERKAEQRTLEAERKRKRLRSKNQVRQLTMAAL